MADVISIAAGASAIQVQTAIDTAAAGATIRLGAGQFNFTRTVVIDRDDITITGAGQGRTVITADARLDGAPAFRIGSALFEEDKSDPVGMTYAAEGARQIHLKDGHGLQRGDMIWMEQANDEALFKKIGDTAWREETPLRTALVEVTAVHGNTVSLDRPLPFSFKSTGSTVEKIETARNVTLENLTLRGDYGTADPANFSNTLRGQDGGMMLLVNATDHATLNNIAIKNAASNGLVIAKSVDASVEDITVTGAHEKGDSGNGYGVWIRDVYDSDFRDLTIHDTRHGVLFASYTSAVGNTVHVLDTNRDINFHGGLDHDNTVIVDRSGRTAVEAEYLAAVSYVNNGTVFGAPTDPDANSITFREVWGTVRADLVPAAAGGATISTRGGDDTLIGGSGSDLLKAGTGDDLIYASRGSDTVYGGYGDDTVVLDAWRSDVKFSQDGDALVVRGDFGTMRMFGVQGVALNNDWYAVADLMAQAAFADAGFLM
jgi:Ca2+-binding RTX toxin-like protein